MTFYIKQRFFSWGETSIYDSAGNEIFHAVPEIFTFGRKLHIFDALDNELVYIKQKVFSFLPRYFVYRGETEIAEVIKEFTFFKHEYTVSGPDWSVHGDFFDHEYEISDGTKTIASVSKEWFTLGDAYEITVNDSADIPLALAIVLIIDACIDDAQD